MGEAQIIKLFISCFDFENDCLLWTSGEGSKRGGKPVLGEELLVTHTHKFNGQRQGRLLTNE